MAAFKDVGNRALLDRLARVSFPFVLSHSVPHSGFDDRGGGARLQKTQPTERLVELKVKVLTTGDTEGHKGRSPGASRLFSKAPMLGLHP
jgi:hypothetical protein